ncbi:unnamed protein product [Durusdinium trenchii]|uniref:Vesicle transport protein GOT1A n=2 Tax=Durusdinium trenchii TaxID=1381693 RepID=A0ABP0HN79_9DINO
MAGGEISERPDICKDVLKTPPRRRAERLACGLPAYVNCQLDGLDNPAPREIPQVEEPMRARPPNLQPKPPHAAPGAFEIPAELLTYPIPPQIVVGLAQESFNRWLNNISTEISHKNRDVGPLYIDEFDLQSLRDRRKLRFSSCQA